ncbi:MAG: multicomponent Na+:H+ antiporter subunit D, partial [Colwellia sp.]
MNFSLEVMLQLTIAIPLLTIVGIILANKRPNIREGITISASIFLLFIVTSLYQNLLSGKNVNVFWWDIMPNLS